MSFRSVTTLFGLIVGFLSPKIKVYKCIKKHPVQSFLCTGYLKFITELI